MNYAIHTLEQERALIEKCLNDWYLDHNPEARTLREKRLKELDNAIKLLNDK